MVLACSFQKEESVLIDMLMRVAPDARVFTIDTGVLFPETYAVWKQVEDRYGLKVEVYDAANPERPWTGGDHCCGANKVCSELAPMRRSVTGGGVIFGPRRLFTRPINSWG